MHTLNELNSWVCQSNDPNNNQQVALHSQLSGASQLNPNTGGILLSNTVELVTGGEDLVMSSSNLLNGQQPPMSIQCTVSGESDLVQNNGAKIFGSNRGLSFVKYPSNQQFQPSSLSNGHLSAASLNGHLPGNLGAANLLNNQNNSSVAFNQGAYSLLHQSMNSLAGTVSTASNNSNSSTLSSSSSNNSLNYTSLNLSHNSSSEGTSPSTTIGQQQQLASQQSGGLSGGQYSTNGYANNSGQLTYSSFDQLMAANPIPTPSPEQQWLPNSPQHSPDQHLHHQTVLQHHPHHASIAQNHHPNHHPFTSANSQHNSQQHSPQHHINLPTPPSLANGNHHTQRDLAANQFQPQQPQSNRRLERHYNGHYSGYNAFNQTQQRQQVSVGSSDSELLI